MKIRILRNYGELQKDQIIEATGNTKQFMLENGIACVAPQNDDDCEDCDGDCEDCKGKNKKSKPAPVKKAPAKKQSTTKKKATKKPASKK